MNDEQMKVLQQKTRELKNDKLLETIRRLKSEGTESTELQEQYIEEMMKARFIVPVTVKAMDENDDKKMQVQFSHLKNKKGDLYFMAFTDTEALKALSPEWEKLQLLGVTYKDFGGILGDPKCKMKGFAINPCTENIIIGVDQAKMFAQYMRNKQFKEGKLTVIKELTDAPEDDMRKIEKYFDECGNIKKAYMLFMETASKKNRLIIVDAEEGVDFPEFAKKFGHDILAPMNDEAMPYIIMSLEQDAAKNAVKEQVPFYVKI